MVLTLKFVNVKSRKYLLTRRIVCGCTVNKTYITLIHPEINNMWILDTIDIKATNNMNRCNRKMIFYLIFFLYKKHHSIAMFSSFFT